MSRCSTKSRSVKKINRLRASYGRDLDKSKPPDMYKMRVIIFGAKCSPTLANFVLRKIAEDHKTDTAESLAAARSVTRHFYMDNFLK